jgi:mannose-6-phosphate isomerase-like protein (cupin superfamily)
MNAYELNVNSRPVAQFPEAESVGPREWGEEILLVLSSGKYTMKKLFIKAGKKGGLQFHRKKDEASYIVSGEMILRYEDINGKLQEKKVGPGDWFHFPAGCIHQEEAVTDVVRIEVSTPHFNDRVRVEGVFGIEDKEGLQTTFETDIEVR